MRWIERIADESKTDFRELLLMGDEQWDQVTRYLWRGALFALREDAETRAIALVTQLWPGTDVVGGDRRRAGDALLLSQLWL